LLKHGAKPNVSNDIESAPLHFAAVPDALTYHTQEFIKRSGNLITRERTSSAD
jgi:hypothetical protein